MEKFTLEDIQNMINDINSAKSCGPNSIPTNLLKTHFSIFAEPLKDLINQFRFEENFQICLKLSTYVLYIKEDTNFVVKIIGQSHSYLTSANCLKEQCIPG